MMILETVLLGFIVLSVSYLLKNRYFSGGVCTSKNRLDGKNVIITGGNTGIGFETGLDLAKRGARVILACRDKQKATEAVNKIKEISNNMDVESVHLDLADLSSIRKFSKLINSKIASLDILINNAGIMMCPYWKTKDGFEMQFGTNHLGHFLLTNLLLDLLKNSQKSRIITLSSRAHYGYFPSKNGFAMNWTDLNWTNSYHSLKAYSQSKLANILFTKELAKRLKGTNVTSVCLHPGVVRTELITKYSGGTLFFWFPYFLKAAHILYVMLTKTVIEGAQTSIYCAVADDIEKYNGYYFSDCKPKKPSRNAMNDEDAKRLWKLSEDMVKLHQLNQ